MGAQVEWLWTTVYLQINLLIRASGGDLWVSEFHHKGLKRLRSYSLQDFLLISDIKGTNMSFQWLFYNGMHNLFNLQNIQTDVPVPEVNIFVFW